MRKFNRESAIILVMLTMILLVFVYSTETSNMSNFKKEYTPVIANEGYSPKPYLSLSSLPKQYSYNLAIDQGDVVSRLGKVANLEKLDKFIKDYEAKALKNNDMIRITTYSIVGTPVIHDLVFTNEGLKLTVDPTRVSRKFKVEESKVSNILTAASGENITYLVKTDTNKEIPLISTSKKIDEKGKVHNY
jgi:hypothetical protein